jgi:hypothetical protein
MTPRTVSVEEALEADGTIDKKHRRHCRTIGRLFWLSFSARGVSSGRWHHSLEELCMVVL